MQLRPTDHRKVACAVHAAFAEITSNSLEEALYTSNLLKKVFWITILFGPSAVLMEDDDDEDDDKNIAGWAHLYEVGAFADEPMDEAEENAAEDQPPDELGQVLVGAQKDNEIVKESKKFEKMLVDEKKLLYPDCK